MAKIPKKYRKAGGMAVKNAENKKETEKCKACSGSGYYDNTGSPPCVACDGTGIKKKWRGCF